MDSASPLLDVTSLSFEDALKELEGVVRRLEEGRLPLEEAIGSYERGALLKERCETLLAQARLKVDAIAESTQGTPTLETFHHDDE